MSLVRIRSRKGNRELDEFNFVQVMVEAQLASECGVEVR